MFKGPSAILGTPPLNDQDILIIKWFMLSTNEKYPQLKALLDPKVGFPYIAKPKNEAERFTVRDREATTVWGGIVIACLVAYIFTRLCVRFFLTQIKWGWDDLVYFVATLGGIANTALNVYNVTEGTIGYHIWNLTYADLGNLPGLACTNAITYFVTLGLVKISVTLWLQKAVGRSSRGWRWFCDGLLTFNGIYILWALFAWPVSLGGFHQLRAYYDFNYATKNEVVFNGPAYIMPVIVLGIIGAAVDFVLALMPVVLFFNLKVKKSKKIRLCLLFILGIISTAIAVVRSVVILKMDLNKMDDATWYSYDLVYWSSTEMWLSFTIASMPMFNIIWVQYHDRSKKGRSCASRSEKSSGLPIHYDEERSSGSSNYGKSMELDRERSAGSH